MIVGTVVSTRFTLNVQLAELPAASVTVNVTTVVPTPDNTAVPEVIAPPVIPSQEAPVEE